MLKQEEKNVRLCGNIYHGQKCEYLLYADKDNMIYQSEKLKQYHVYCTSENKLRSMGLIAAWVNFYPRWCPKLKERGEDIQWTTKN